MRTVVVGCGGVGLSAVQVGAALGGSVVAVDVRDEPLDFAAEQGARWTVNTSDVDDVPARIRELTGGAGVSVDALGASETCRNAGRCH